MVGRRFLGAAAALAAAGALLWQSQAVASGVRAGLEACAAVVIPSLFPFMILAGLCSSTPAGQALSNGIWRLFRWALPLPRQLGAVFLMSFLGGFPVGARMLSDLVAQKRIDPKTASRALCFCVNAGPSFLISAVGGQMLGSLPAGLALLAAQICSALVIARVTLRRQRQKPNLPAFSYPPFATAFVESVRSACAGILSICAFVVAFSAFAALLQATGIFHFLAAAVGGCTGWDQAFVSALFTGILEVTAGCLKACALGGQRGFLLCAFLVSSASLSIFFQVRSCFPAKTPVRFGPLAISRLAHGALTTGFALLFSRLLPPAVLAAGSFSSVPVPKAAPHTAAITLCLMGMCTILVLFPSRRSG